MKRISKVILLSGVVATHLIAQQAPDTCTTGIVSNNADSGNDTLRACIDNAQVGNTITFSKDMNISLSNTIAMNAKNILIDGKDNTIILDGGGTLSPVLSVLNSSVIISNITVQNGKKGIALVNSTATIKNSLITKNLGVDKQDGSGIILDVSNLTIDNSTISKNKADAYGGGLYLMNGSTLTLTNSTVSDNNATNGAGLYFTGSTLTMSDSTISGNNAIIYGGGIYTDKSTLNIVHTTITKNKSIGYSAMYNLKDGGSISIEKSIMAGNVNSSTKYQEFSTIISSGYNLLGNGTFTDTTSVGNITNPQLSALANNTGNTLTHMPLEGSPAISKGGTTKNPSTDQIGKHRPSSNITIGAVQFILPIASGISFSGTLKDGETLTATYTYSDVHNYSEAGTQLQWYRSDDVSGANKIAISGATSTTYILTSTDIGKFMSFGVIPKSTKGTGILSSSAINATAVDNINTAPTITIDNIIAIEQDTEKSISFIFNDIDGDTVIATEKTAPNNGTLEIVGTSIKYTPNIGFYGGDSFIISFNDQQGSIIDKTVIVVVSEKVVPTTPPASTTPTAPTETTPIDFTVAEITRIISNLPNTLMLTDKETQVITVSVEVEAESGFVYKAIIVTDKDGKSRTKVIKIEVATKKETVVSNTLKNNQQYPAGSHIELLFQKNELVIKITTKIYETLIIE